MNRARKRPDMPCQSTVDCARLVSLATGRWICAVLCLLIVAGGPAALVACGVTPQTTEPGATQAEALSVRDSQPTETQPAPQAITPSPEPLASETSVPPQDTSASDGGPGDPSNRDYWPTKSWRTSSPEAQGMDSARLEEMMSLIDEDDLAIDSVLVVRHGYLVLEEYPNYYGQNSIHHLQSVTKSFTSMLIGIAMHQGLIYNVEQRLVDFFPDQPIQNMDARKEKITLEHLLTMSVGMDWHELDYPYDDLRNTLGRMWYSRDAVQHVLDRPMARDPGQVWAYNSGTSILLGGILEQVTQRDVLDFARETLFDPIGIGDVDWSKTTGGHYHTDGGLWMTPRDMARFGYLMLNQGTWDGQEIVSRQWVERSTTTHYQIPGGYGYGYQWWTMPDVGAYAATGHYEQKIYVVPRADLVVVFTADIADQDPHPTDDFLAQYIVPACSDLPALVPVEIYAQHGFTFEYPLGAYLLETPIPGRDAVSDASGMVQFNTLYPPLELIRVVWDQVEEGVDVERYLDQFVASISQETGVEYDWGQSSKARKDGHDLVLRYFRTTANGLPFSGVMGIWHCPQARRIYLLTCAVTPEKAAGEVLAACQQHLDSLVCHQTD